MMVNQDVESQFHKRPGSHCDPLAHDLDEILQFREEENVDTQEGCSQAGDLDASFQDLRLSETSQSHKLEVEKEETTLTLQHSSSSSSFSKIFISVFEP